MGRHLLTALVCALALAASLPAAEAAGGDASGVEAAAAAARGSATDALRRAKTAQRRARRADKRAKQALRVARQFVTSAKILDGAVTAADIADGAVQASEIATDAVNAAKIAADAVGASEIAAGAVGAVEIQKGAVGGDELRDDSVTTAEIAFATITAADIAAGAVSGSEIATDAVGTSELAPDSVTTAEILANTVAIGDIDQSVWSSAHGAGTLAGRPAASASNEGFLYFAADDNGGTLYRSNGTSWVKAAPGVSQAPTLPESIAMVNEGNSSTTWSSMPVAETEFNNSARYRTKYDLSNANQARLVLRVQTGGAAGAEIRAQYSTTDSSSDSDWNSLDGGSGPSVNVATSGTKVSSWVTLAAGANGDVFLRLVGIGGDGAASPAFGQISIQVR